MAIVIGTGTASAHHIDNGHAGYLYPDVSQYELNARTSTGQGIQVQLGVYNSLWANAYTNAIANWNLGLSAAAGFNVYADVSSGGTITVTAGTSNLCPPLSDGSVAHGCIIGSTWIPDVPQAQIYMYSPAFTTLVHRTSDLMHEMGHVLYNAGEHYNLPGYGCSGTPSIMNHCLLTNVEADDVADYRSAYRIMDAPDATYVQMSGAGTLVHYFEGSYFGGNGRTLHQEQYSWIDRSTTGVSGSYLNYSGTVRQVSDVDDGVPISNSINDAPTGTQEWCFKRRGRAGGVVSSDPGYWGPYSRAYCIRRSGNGVFIATNRNDYVVFRIWNYSGSTINFVSILLNDGTTHVCDLPDIPNGSSQYCFWTGAGASSGSVTLWYGWINRGTVGYDAR